MTSADAETDTVGWDKVSASSTDPRSEFGIWDGTVGDDIGSVGDTRLGPTSESVPQDTEEVILGTIPGARIPCLFSTDSINSQLFDLDFWSILSVGVFEINFLIILAFESANAMRKAGALSGDTAATTRSAPRTAAPQPRGLNFLLGIINTF